MSRDYTDDELAGLTEQEREALLDDSDESGERPTPSNVDGDVHDDEEALELDDEVDTDADADADDKAAVADDADAAATVEDDDSKAVKPAVSDQPPAPILHVDAPADADARLEELKAKKEELAEQFDNGDLTGREYQSQLDDLNRQERGIEQEVFKAQIASEMSATQAKNAWVATVNEFLGEHEEYGASKLRHSALNETVKEIAADETKSGLSGRQILELAHERVSAELGGVAPSNKQTEKSGGEKQAGKKEEVIPPNIGKLPSAEISDTEGNRFASLDRLATTDPLKYESQFAKLSPADRDAYLAQ